MREKLIELVGQLQYCGCEVTDEVVMNYVENHVLVDHLIANGVTFATDNTVGGKWIPVTERLPENTEKVLALSKSRFGNGYLSWLVRYNPDAGAFYDYDSEWGNIKIHNITHWMPLPEPPKGE